MLFGSFEPCVIACVLRMLWQLPVYRTRLCLLVEIKGCALGANKVARYEDATMQRHRIAKTRSCKDVKTQCGMYDVETRRYIFAHVHVHLDVSHFRWLDAFQESTRADMACLITFPVACKIAAAYPPSPIYEKHCQTYKSTPGSGIIS